MARSNEMIYNQWEFLSLVISIGAFKYLLSSSLPFIYSCVICYIFFSLVIKMKPLFYRYRCKWVPANKVKPLGLIQNLFFMNVISFAEVWYDYIIHDETLDLHISNDTNTNTNTNNGNDKVVSPNKKMYPTESIMTLIDHDKIRNKNCPVLLVGYHSRQTLDLLFFMCRYQTKTVVHDLLCDIPILGDFVKKIGAISSRAHHYNNHAEMNFINELLTNRNNQPVYLLPGGAYECLKYSYEEGKVLWLNEPGFARCIVKFSHLFPNDLLIIPVYTKNCEKLLYTPSTRFHDFVTDNARNLTAFIRKGHFYIIPYAFSLLALSFNLLIFPRVCKLDTYFGEPVRLSSLFPDISISNGSNKHTSWKSTTLLNDNINIATTSNKSCDINSNGKNDNKTNDVLHNNSNNINISYSNVNSSNNKNDNDDNNIADDDDTYTDTDTISNINTSAGPNKDFSENDISNISSASVSSNNCKTNNGGTNTASINSNYDNIIIHDSNNSNNTESNNTSITNNTINSDISSNSNKSNNNNSSSSSNSMNYKNNDRNYDETLAVHLLTERVRNSLQQLIDKVSQLPERHTTSSSSSSSSIEKNYINTTNKTIKIILYATIFKIDDWFKKMIHLFLFTTQNFIFFSFMIVFSWLIYFPISVAVFCLVTREKEDLMEKDKK